MVDSGIRTLNLRPPASEQRWHLIFLLYKTNSARHGQFQEKEINADYWIEYLPFEKKKFDGK